MDCPICMEQLQDFVAVPVNSDLEQVCSHRFCGPCLERHLEMDERLVGEARCPLCRAAFNEINIIQSTTEEDHDDIQLVYESGPINAAQHASPPPNQLSPPERSPPASPMPTSRTYPCHHCHLIFNSRTARSHHLERLRDLRCPQCGKTFTRLVNLQRHSRRLHH